MFNAKTSLNFISKDKCEYIINTVKDCNLWESGGSDFWDNRVINLHKVKSIYPEIFEIMVDANMRCSEFIKKEFNLNNDIYSDTLQIIRWFEGMNQPPHADDMTNTDIEGFDHRMFGSIIYLNNNYSGGHTFYPNFDFSIQPEVGKLAVHPGDPEHLHGVTKIEGGIRYTIASFWTMDRSKFVNY